MNSTTKDRLYTVLSVLILLTIWKGLADLINQEIYLPSPEATLKNLIGIVGKQGFFMMVFNTIKRSLISFSIAFSLGIILGVLAGIFKPVYYLLKPLIIIKKAVPTISIILVVLLWLGSKSPVLIGFLVIFPIIYTNVVEGVRNVEPKLIEMASMYKVNKWRVLQELYLPSIIPYVMAASSTALGLNLKVIIAAEVWSDSRISVGEGLLLDKISVNIPGLFAWTIVAILISAFFDYLLKIVERRIVKWK